MCEISILDVFLLALCMTSLFFYKFNAIGFACFLFFVFFCCCCYCLVVLFILMIPIYGALFCQQSLSISDLWDHTFALFSSFYLDHSITKRNFSCHLCSFLPRKLGIPRRAPSVLLPHYTEPHWNPFSIVASHGPAPSPWSFASPHSFFPLVCLCKASWWREEDNKSGAIFSFYL